MSDDWSEDFDLQPVAGPSSSSSKPFPRSRGETQPPQPLRHAPSRSQLKLKSLNNTPNPSRDTLDEMEDFDVPDSFAFTTTSPTIPPPHRISSKASSSSNHTLRNLSKTIISTNNTGPGVITRLGPKIIPSSSSVKQPLPTSSVKARAAAYEQSFERDIDFAPASTSGNPRKLTLSLPKQRGFIPSTDDLDDPGWDDEDEDQATLKAGATVKGLLPPKRDKSGDVATVKPKTPVKKSEEEDSWDNDFEVAGGLPLSFDRLKLVGAAGSGKWGRNVKTSVAQSSTDWGSPGNGSGSVKGWEDSPGRSETETSRTSISSGLSLPDKEKQRERDMDRAHVVDEDDMEDGLVITESALFASGSAKMLNGLLDLKRRFRPEGRDWQRNEAVGKGDGSFEDGLVLNDTRGELSRRKLRETINARAAAGLIQTRKVSGGRNMDEERAREKELEKGWGRHTPIQPIPPPRTRTYSTLSRHTPLPRSQSATTTKEIPRNDTTSRSARPRPSVDSIAMPPPPIPSHASSSRQPQPPTPSPSKGLRHQKSQYTLPTSTPLPSPSLHRNRSQASLQHVDIGASPVNTIKPGKSTYSSSTSRLHDPTKSSASKARLPFKDIFPTATGSGGDAVMGSKGGDIRMTLRRTFRGNGTELDAIEDLVDDGVKKNNSGGIGMGKPGSRGHISPPNPTTKGKSSARQDSLSAVPEKRKRETRTKRAAGPGLLRYMGSTDPNLKLKEFKMKNPGACTISHYDLKTGWAGNEDALNVFDDIPTLPNAGPSLITLDSSTLNYTSLPNIRHDPNSLDPNSTIKIVGEMKFDTERMCWVSIHDDEEPDPFEGLADDEDEEGGGGATITRATGRLMEIRLGLGGGRLASESSVSTSGGSEWGVGSRERDEAFERLRKECREAEKRHTEEMRGWLLGRAGGVGGAGRRGEDEKDRKRRERDEGEREMRRLWEIRNLAI